MSSGTKLYDTIISLPQETLKKSIEGAESNYNQKHSSTTKNTYSKQTLWLKTVINLTNILELSCYLYFWYNYSFIALSTLLLLTIIKTARENISYLEEEHLKENADIEYKETIASLDTIKNITLDE